MNKKNEMQKKNRYKDDTLKEIIESIKIFIDYLIKALGLELITDESFCLERTKNDLQNFFILLSGDVSKKIEEKIRISAELHNFFEWCSLNINYANQFKFTNLNNLKEECKIMRIEYESVKKFCFFF
jgi:hypothetical protein